MALITTKDNKKHLIVSQLDILELIELYMGNEFRDYMKHILIQGDINQLIEQKKKEIELKKINSDYMNYEENLNENNIAFEDILNNINKIKQVIKAKRINKEKLNNELNEIIKTINNQF